MKRISASIFLLLILGSMATVSASENDVQLNISISSITLYPGQTETFDITVISNGDDTPTSTNTSPPNTYVPPTSGPPPAPPLPGSSTGLLNINRSYNLSMPSHIRPMLTTSRLMLTSDPPEGFTVKFSRSELNAVFNKEEHVSVEVYASQDIIPGEYKIPIHLRSNSGHYATVKVTAIVLEYIDIILNEVSILSDAPNEGEVVTFQASVTNDGTTGTGDVMCAMYDKHTNERIAYSIFSLDAGETRNVDVQWASLEGIYELKFFISSPPHEKIVSNNFYFLSLEVGPPDIERNFGEEYYIEGMAHFEAMEWNEALNSFEMSKMAFESKGDAHNASLAQLYIGICNNYIKAQDLYNEGLVAEAEGSFELAKEKFRAAEAIYTELEDRDMINSCFNKLLVLCKEDENAMSTYPWYAFAIPLGVIAIYIGLTNKEKFVARQDSTDDRYAFIFNDLEKKYADGEISEETYKNLTEKWKKRLFNN